MLLKLIYLFFFYPFINNILLPKKNNILKILKVVNFLIFTIKIIMEK